MNLCACKGIRTCLACENSLGLQNSNTFQYVDVPVKLSSGENGFKLPKDDKSGSFCLPGVRIYTDFISQEEELNLINQIDLNSWVNSQSGRRKQDFGPKVNFKKQKVNYSEFNGLPAYSRFIVDQVNKLIKDADSNTDGKLFATGFTFDKYDSSPFCPVELCNLEYLPDRGSAIDPHWDDAWLWGERLVTVNLVSDTKLAFVLPSTGDSIALAKKSAKSSTVLSSLIDEKEAENYRITVVNQLRDLTGENKLSLNGYLRPRVLVPLPRRSLIIVEGLGRHLWQHAIFREDIISRRLALTMRELSVDFMPPLNIRDSNESDKNNDQLELTSEQFIGHRLLEIAQSYNGVSGVTT